MFRAISSRKKVNVSFTERQCLENSRNSAPRNTLGDNNNLSIAGEAGARSCPAGAGAPLRAVTAAPGVGTVRLPGARQELRENTCLKPWRTGWSGAGGTILNAGDTLALLFTPARGCADSVGCRCPPQGCHCHRLGRAMAQARDAFLGPQRGVKKN